MIRPTLALTALLAALTGAVAAPSTKSPESKASESKAPDLKAYDGRWSVEVVTRTGDCDRAYRYAILIENGQARYGSNDFEVKGRVTPTGTVAASIARGSDRADVVGTLADGGGSGTWTTSGARTCGGVWNAERRG